MTAAPMGAPGRGSDRLAGHHPGRFAELVHRVRDETDTPAAARLSP